MLIPTPQGLYTPLLCTQPCSFLLMSLCKLWIWQTREMTLTLHIWVFRVTGRAAGLRGCSIHALCLAFLCQIQFFYQSFSFQKGAKETGFNCRDFSTLTGLADNLERKGSGDKAGLVPLPCAVLILSKPITLPLASVTFAVVLSPGFRHIPSVRVSLSTLCF